MESLSIDLDRRFLLFPREFLLVLTFPGEAVDDSSEAIFTVTSELLPPSKVDLDESFDPFDDWSLVSTPRIRSSFVSLVSLTMKSSHA